MELYTEIEKCEVLLNLYQMAALVFALFVESRDVIWSNVLDKACDKMAQLDSKLNYSHKGEMIDMQKFLKSAKEEYSNGLTWKNLGENLSPDSVMNEKKRVNKEL